MRSASSSDSVSNVIEFPGLTFGDLPAADVLNGALEQDLDKVLVIGVRKDDMAYFASSMGYAPDILWLLERYKRAILDNADL